MRGEVPVDAAIYPLADWLVGPFAHAERSANADATPALEQWQVPFYDVALGALKRLANTNELAPGWMPTPQQGADLYRELAYERKVHGMATSLKSYIHDYKTGALDTKLRDEQQTIFDALADNLAANGTDKVISVKSPTGTGKTAVLTTLIAALKYKEQPADKVRALVLVPTKDILDQTMRAFGTFTDLEPGVYFGEKQEVRDVTTMTYQSFEKALNRGAITREMFDVVVRDESHEFADRKIGRLIRNYCFDLESGKNKAVFALSATPKGEKDLAYKKTLVEAISDGLVSPVMTREIDTGSKVEETLLRGKKRAEFIPADLRDLMKNDSRNNIIIDEVISGLAEGRRVMVRCLPGAKMAHARHLQERLNKIRTDIKHPYVGDTEKRAIRAVVIKGDMPLYQRKILTGIFNNHLDERIDVLLFVGTLTRGFDSPVCKKIINSSPTRSWTLIEQLLGRGVRPFQRMDGRWMYSEVVSLVDLTDNGQLTFRDVLDRDAPQGMRYVRGAIVGKDLRDLRFNGSGPGSAYEPIPADELQAHNTRLFGDSGFFYNDNESLDEADPDAEQGNDNPSTNAVVPKQRDPRKTAPKRTGPGMTQLNTREITPDRAANMLTLHEASDMLNTTPARVLELARAKVSCHIVSTTRTAFHTL